MPVRCASASRPSIASDDNTCHPVRRIRIGGRGGWVAGDHVSPELGCRSWVIIT
jgi:hypothetical protein